MLRRTHGGLFPKLGPISAFAPPLVVCYAPQIVSEAAGSALPEGISMHWRGDELSVYTQDENVQGTSAWPAAVGRNGNETSNGMIVKHNAIDGHSVLEGIALSEMSVATSQYTGPDSDLFVVFKGKGWNPGGWWIWEWTGSGETGIAKTASNQLLELRENATVRYSETGVEDQWYIYHRRSYDPDPPGTNHWTTWLNGVEIYDAPSAGYDGEAVRLSGASTAHDGPGVQFAEVLHWDDRSLDVGDTATVYSYLASRFPSI